MATEAMSSDPIKIAGKNRLNLNIIFTGKLLSFLILLILCCFWVINPFEKPVETLLLSSLVFVVGMAPIRRWIKDVDRSRIPIFELHCLFYGVCFGFAGFIVDPYNQSNPNKVITEQWLQAGLIAALLGLCGLLAGYRVLGPIFFRHRQSFTFPFVLNSRKADFFLFWVFPGIILLNNLQKIVPELQLKQFLNIAEAFMFLLLLCFFAKKNFSLKGNFFFYGSYCPIYFWCAPVWQEVRLQAL